MNKKLLLERSGFFHADKTPAMPANARKLTALANAISIPVVLSSVAAKHDSAQAIVGADETNAYAVEAELNTE